MFAGVNSANVVGIATVENDSSPDIPEWKKILIMKKRAVNNSDEFWRRNPDSPSAGGVNIPVRNGGCESSNSLCNKFGRSVKVEQEIREISPPKKVTIGNINVELRSVKSTPDAQKSFWESPKSDVNLNAELNGQELENGGCEDLPYGPGIVDRLRAKFLNLGAKQRCEPVVRRFSSLENLPGSNALPYRVNTRGIRPNGFKSGVGNFFGHNGSVKKAQSMETLLCTSPEQQTFARRPNARFVGVKARIAAKNISPMLTDENAEPSPPIEPLLRRWEYNRSVSASSINEDELPKPDTVKHVKKMFESPPLATTASEKCVRFRKTPTPTPTCGRAAAVKKPGEDCPEAKTSAKDLCIPTLSEESPEREEEICEDLKIIRSDLLDDKLSANGSAGEATFSASSQEGVITTPESIVEEEIPVFTDSKVTRERFSPEEEDIPQEEALSPVDGPAGKVEERAGMVVAASAESSKKGAGWQQQAPSVVFDFRGKDVKPNVSLNPAPFGCRPAAPRKKRSGSPPRSPELSPEDWDETDIGADLPAHSGIEFEGENVKIGRGALLEKRNKQLTIQFDDGATSTFEYPSENTSPSPGEENVPFTESFFNPSVALGSLSNSRQGLSSYTPQVLGIKEFELGVSQSNHRPVSLPDKSDAVEDIPLVDAIIPANPNDTGGWSSTETADILF